MHTKIVTIDLGERSYDIYIGAGLIHNIKTALPFDPAGQRAFIITDDNVKLYAGHVKESLERAGVGAVEMLSLPAGEKTKSFAMVERLTAWLLNHKVSRDSVILAVGGGVIGDITGFCASIVLRGIPYIQIPTTLLAQVDSAVGGKTGINTKHGKNLIGSFYQPSAVIIDLDTLDTLPERELRAGYAEVVKYGLINDYAFFEWLEENSAAVMARDTDALTRAIETSVMAKAGIVQADEREAGQRALLNLGHTFGHALEAVAGYDGRLLHGEAVAMGIIMALDVSYNMDLCSADEFMRVERHFQKVGLLTRASYITPALNTSVEALFEMMHQDKKVSKGQLNLILMNEIGSAFITNDFPDELVKDAIRQSLGGDISGSGSQKKGIRKQWMSIFSSR